MKLKLYPIIVIALLAFQCSFEIEENQVMRDLVVRLLPQHANSFLFQQIPKDDNRDVFEIQSLNDKIVIRGNTNGAMARGLNHYLREFCHLSTSWDGQNMNAPEKLPVVSKPVRIVAAYPIRYYLNYCTYSYSMPYWNWQRWEKEIDWMAMQGVNMPLAITGQYAVWQNTLRRIGYREDEIKSFLPGPGFEAWFLMGNLESFGGPVSQDFIDNQTSLQKKIIERMRSYGMDPVLQGFYGMVPNSLIAKKPKANITSTGKWLNYDRPAFLDPSDPLFGEIASIWYEEQEKLFGKAKYFGGDPFHEGGRFETVDAKKAAQQIFATMKESNDKPVWVLQGWQKNPTKELLSGLEPGETIVLDLMACTRPQWGGIKESLFYKETGHLGHPWVWCALPNFGGRIGMYGRLPDYANGALKARNHPMGKNLMGIGAAPEGIGSNPVDYDLIFDAAWSSEPIDVQEWITQYTHYRYGKTNKLVEEAWKILATTSYNCKTSDDGPQESVFCARPALKIDHVSSWGTAKLYYDPQKLVEALRLFLLAESDFKDSDTFQYDIVDLMRQINADRGKIVLEQVASAFKENKKKDFEKYASEFSQLMIDEDSLLSTRKEFLLGNWLESAKSLGNNDDEKKLFERNARYQITTWADVKSDLHDYAHKEWSGMLKDFYLPRWQLFFENLRRKMNGEDIARPDFFVFEKNWCQKTNIFANTPRGSSLDRVKELFEKSTSNADLLKK